MVGKIHNITGPDPGDFNGGTVFLVVVFLGAILGVLIFK